MMKECPLFHKKPIGCISMLLFTILGTEEQQIEFFFKHFCCNVLNVVCMHSSCLLY